MYRKLFPEQHPILLGVGILFGAPADPHKAKRTIGPRFSGPLAVGASLAERLSLPTHTDPVAISSGNKDRLAIDVFQHAESLGEPITLNLVERRLDELRGHEPGCACGLCTAAAGVGAPSVLYVVRRWAGGIAASRRRAMR
jgi:hypothetical protein